MNTWIDGVVKKLNGCEKAPFSLKTVVFYSLFRDYSLFSDIFKIGNARYTHRYLKNAGRFWMD